MNKSTIQQTKKFLQKVNIYKKNLLPELMRDKEYFAVIPFIKVLKLRDYIFARMINEIPAGQRKARGLKYKEISLEYGINLETLKKIICEGNKDRATYIYKKGGSLREVTKEVNIPYNVAGEIIRKSGLTRKNNVEKKLETSYRESWIITEADIEEDFKTRIFK
jgi:hypothetical protein